MEDGWPEAMASEILHCAIKDPELGLESIADMIRSACFASGVAIKLAARMHARQQNPESDVQHTALKREPN